MHFFFKQNDALIQRFLSTKFLTLQKIHNSKSNPPESSGLIQVFWRDIIALYDLI